MGLSIPTVFKFIDPDLFHAHGATGVRGLFLPKNRPLHGTIRGLAGFPAPEGRDMKKIHEYREHAAECREMARVASATHRAQLEQMAATWDQLAEARARQLAKDGKTEDDDSEQAGKTVPRPSES
jgi:hypothetical protein